MGNLQIGSVAPDFTGKTSAGDALRLSDFKNKKNVVLYFYPKDFTPGCTAEACSFRDAYDELLNQDTEVIGVSLDSSHSHKNFAERYGIRFPLLADEDGSIAKQYGAIGMLGSVLGMARRMTFVIDKNGVIRGIFRHELAISKHLDDVRKALREASAS